jgi:hypothetical protein
MAGAAGCGISLVMVGSLIAAYGHDWPSHVVAGRVAIGECHRNDLCALDTLTRSTCSLCVYLRRQLFLFVGTDRMGPAQRNLQPRHEVHGRFDHYLDDVDV